MQSRKHRNMSSPLPHKTDEAWPLVVMQTEEYSPSKAFAQDSAHACAGDIVQGEFRQASPRDVTKRET